MGRVEHAVEDTCTVVKPRAVCLSSFLCLTAIFVVSFYWNPSLTSMQVTKMYSRPQCYLAWCCAHMTTTFIYIHYPQQGVRTVSINSYTVTYPFIQFTLIFIYGNRMRSQLTLQCRRALDLDKSPESLVRELFLTHSSVKFNALYASHCVLLMDHLFC